MGGSIGETDTTERTIKASQKQSTCHCSKSSVCDPALRRVGNSLQRGLRCTLMSREDSRHAPNQGSCRRNQYADHRCNDQLERPQVVWVGSFAVSTAIRARIGAGTAAPTPRMTPKRRALPTARAAAASTPTTIKPVPYKVLGSDTFEYGIC